MVFLFLEGDGMDQDEFYMKRALELARKAEGETSPNPMVGCVILDAEGRVAGEGWHHKAGQPHAEIMAMEDMKRRNMKGHTAYVSLEPCSHYGRTGPCCDALIRAGFKRVVAAWWIRIRKWQGGGSGVCATPVSKSASASANRRHGA